MAETPIRAAVFTRRALMLGGAQGLLMSALVGRIYQLQITQSDDFRVQAEDNRINLRLLPPPRGRILDRFGVPLAVNEQTYRVVVVKEQAGDVAATLVKLAKVMVLSEAEKTSALADSRRKRPFVPVTVRENLTWDQVAAVEVNAPDLPGIAIEVGQSRHYLLGGSTAHILGYVGAVAEGEQTGDPLLELPGFDVGKSGFEKQHDALLRGSAGSSQVEVNALGRVIRELSRQEGKPGEDLRVTLDSGLQQFVQQRLASEMSGSAVVLDVRDGGVLAIGSTPTFDPSAFSRGLSTDQWRELVSDPLKPLSDKAIQGQYAPGSTFKMMVTLAALAGGVSPEHRVFCPGFTTLGQARFHCWKKEGHGSLDMHGGLKNSCDVYFYDVARRAGIDAIAAMARRFGLGAPVDIDLPGERPGLIPDRAWKLATMGEPWQPGETLVAGIGQGFILTTPLQLAVMTARIANGGRAVKPHLLHGTADKVLEGEAPDLGIDPEHLAVAFDGMNAVTNEPGGTAYRVRIEQPGMEMAGKTGTAQVRRITLSERAAGVKKNEDMPWEQRDHALFLGFAPVHDPAYAVAVVIEHGGGGSKIAGPIAHDILLETQLRDPSRRSGRPSLAAL
jgi:penicillin-binding protein 2